MVRGSVQGVFFRDGTREQADSAAVDGWVRNLPDGSVEAVLEGAPEAVETVLAWCRSGPSGADVRDVDVEPLEPTGARGFEVRG